MAGVKGRSGGARPNSGPKPKKATPVIPVDNSAETPSHPPLDASVYADPLAFLRAAWMGVIDASPGQIRAASAALPFVHQKLGEGGKKEGRQKAAEKVASRFAASNAPKLAASGGKKV